MPVRHPPPRKCIRLEGSEELLKGCGGVRHFLASCADMRHHLGESSLPLHGRNRNFNRGKRLRVDGEDAGRTRFTGFELALPVIGPEIAMNVIGKDLSLEPDPHQVVVVQSRTSAVNGGLAY